MTSAPALAEWNFLGESDNDHRFFVDLDTLIVGKRPRVWILDDYPQADKYGDMSSKILYEANCAEGQFRQLQFLYYSRPFGKDPTSSIRTTPYEWVYPPPEVLVKTSKRFFAARSND